MAQERFFLDLPAAGAAPEEWHHTFHGRRHVGNLSHGLAFAFLFFSPPLRSPSKMAKRSALWSARVAMLLTTQLITSLAFFATRMMSPSPGSCASTQLHATPRLKTHGVWRSQVELISICTMS